MVHAAGLSRRIAGAGAKIKLDQLTQLLLSRQASKRPVSEAAAVCDLVGPATRGPAADWFAEHRPVLAAIRTLVRHGGVPVSACVDAVAAIPNRAAWKDTHHPAQLREQLAAFMAVAYQQLSEMGDIAFTPADAKARYNTLNGGFGLRRPGPEPAKRD